MFALWTTDTLFEGWWWNKLLVSLIPISCLCSLVSICCLLWFQLLGWCWKEGWNKRKKSKEVLKSITVQWAGSETVSFRFGITRYIMFAKMYYTNVSLWQVNLIQRIVHRPQCVKWSVAHQVVHDLHICLRNPLFESLSLPHQEENWIPWLRCQQHSTL